MVGIHSQRSPRLAVVLCVSTWTALTAVAAFGEDLEASSVIPIARSSAETTGQRITVETISVGDSSRQMRQFAISELPMSQMSPGAQRFVRGVLGDISLYRRLPQIQLEAGQETYQYFANHPDVAVSIWRAMQISQVELTETSLDLYKTDTHDGTIGMVQVLLKQPGHYIIACNGEFKTPAWKTPIKARALMHLQPTYFESGIVRHKLDMYVAFDSNTVGVIARLVSPVSNRIADRNFEEVSLFVEMMHLAMSRQPGWVEQISEKMDGIAPTDKEELLSLTAQTYVAAVRKEQESLVVDPVNEIPLPPLKTAISPSGMQERQ